MITFLLIWWLSGVLLFFLASYLHNDAVTVKDALILGGFVSLFLGPILGISGILLCILEKFDWDEILNKEILKKRK